MVLHKNNFRCKVSTKILYEKSVRKNDCLKKKEAIWKAKKGMFEREISALSVKNGMHGKGRQIRKFNNA